jgi:hypothetical protein
LVFEEKGFFTGSLDLGRFAGILIYKLPFWHYTTPLRAQLGRRNSARRWLLLCSYDIDRKRGEGAVEVRAKATHASQRQRSARCTGKRYGRA